MKYKDSDSNEVEANVLFFGGGYDDNQDSSLITTEDSDGRAVFMVNASAPTSGDQAELIWSAGSNSSFDLEIAEMLYSIPNSPSIADIDGDGFIDQMYISDTGGQILRVDLHNGNTLEALVTGGVVADISTHDAVADTDAEATAINQANNRKFYSDISATVQVNDNQPYVNLAIGSGWRANPLEKLVDNRIYSIKQSFTIPRNEDGDISYTILTEGDLFDATSNVIQVGNAEEIATAQQTLNGSSGWFFELPDDGEKALSKPLTIGGLLAFSTYVPEQSIQACETQIGVNYLYVVNVLDGTAVYDLDGNDGLDRRQQLNVNGIAPSPIVIIDSEGNPIVLTGTQADSIDSDLIMGRTYWQENN